MFLPEDHFRVHVCLCERESERVRERFSVFTCENVLSKHVLAES